MSAAIQTPFLGAKGSKGVKIYAGPPDFKKELYQVFSESAKNYRVILFSNNGELFAFCDGTCVTVLEVKTFKTLYEINKPKTAVLQFSPCDTYLVTWEPFSGKAGAEENCNMCILKSKTGESVQSLIQKKFVMPLIQWTDDESMAARKINNEIHFYENQDFGKTAKKLHMQKIADFGLSHGSNPYHVACYVPGSKGSPSFVRLFKYPDFDGHPIANKSFFKADTVSFYWSPNGKGLLALTSVDVDKSGSSYYGEQTLHYLGTNGESCMVELGKNGPIYSLQWSPSSTEFAVCYGFMPAKATVYNLQCVPAFDFGTGPRNALNYNAHGNLLVIYGFGNLRGNLEMWDMKKHKLVSQTNAPDSTYLEWCPDGVHFCTATTAPRLQIGNGYKIWHYSGSLLHEFSCGQDEKLYEVKWQNKTSGTYEEQEISYKAVAGISSNKPQASKQAYVPPSARNNPHMIRRITEQYEPPSNAKSTPEDASKNAAAARNKRKKDAKKAKKVQEAVNNEAKPQSQVAQKLAASGEINLTGNPEVDKKIRNLSKKLDAIIKLKEQQDAGKTLEINQLEKIKKEDEILSQLEELRISN